LFLKFIPLKYNNYFTIPNLL